MEKIYVLGRDAVPDLEREMEPHLPKGIPHVFISSVREEGLKELKEALWKALHK